MPRNYIPVFVRKDHEEYDEERAQKWLEEHPNLRSKLLPSRLEKKEPPKPVPLSLVSEDSESKLSIAQINQICPYWEEFGATQAQARFAATYCTNGFNAGKAYKVAVNQGVSNASANALGSRMVQEPAVLKCLEKFTFDWIGECRLELNTKILQTLRAQAFYDPAMFITADGSPAFDKLEDVPADLRCCIVGIKTKYYGKDADRSVTEIELVDRKTALRELSVYINLMRDSKESKSATLSKDTENLLSALFKKGMEVGKDMNNTQEAEVVK